MAEIILGVVIIIGCVLLWLRWGTWSLAGFDKMSYLAKIVSMLWLVGLPFVDYYKWEFKSDLKETRYAITFGAMMLITFSYLAVPFLSLSIPSWNEYLLLDNRVFFAHTIFALLILYTSDRLIVRHLGERHVTYQQTLIKRKKTRKALRLSTDRNAVESIESIEKEILVIKGQSAQVDLTLQRYKITIRYADKAILFSMVITYALYLFLPFAFVIPPNEKLLYASFFEGAQTFSLVISSVIYFLIVRKYGSKTIYGN